MSDKISTSLMVTNRRPSIVMVEGDGSWLIDRNGKRYLDFIQGMAVNCLGHAPRLIAEVIARQANVLINSSPLFFNDQAIKLADLLVANSCFDQVFFTNSGAEANEGAIKLARKWGKVHRSGANEIITMQNAFHGRTLATMSASGKPEWETLFEPKVPGFVRVPLNDLAAVSSAISEKTVAVMLEPIQGEAGVIPATNDFMLGLQQLTSDKKILLIIDEVQTGVGRTGSLFCYQQYGIEPDIMTIGKGLGAGVPLAALLAKKPFCCFEPGEQGGTFNGSALMTATGAAVMEEMLKPGFLEHVKEMGEILLQGLLKLSLKYNLGEVRGKGLLLALALSKPGADRIVETAREKGLLINAPKPDILRFMPALNVSREEIDYFFKKLDAVCSSMPV